MADDIGLGDLSFYHSRRTDAPPAVRTPNIDNLAAAGIRFSDAHSPASLCAPTRYSMITGNYSFRNKRPFGVWSPESDALIEPDGTSIGRIAKAGGYATAFLGKWGLGGVWPGGKRGGKRQRMDYTTVDQGASYYGFDYTVELPQGIQNAPFAIYEQQNLLPFGEDSVITKLDAEQVMSKKPSKAKKGKRAKKSREKVSGGRGDSNWDPTRVGMIIASKAVDYIERRAALEGDQPFFMYYCSQAVHIPHAPPKELNGTKIAGTTAGPHGDMIAELDVQVGMIVDALKQTGQYDNTLLVFTSDNGGLTVDRALIRAGHVTSNGMRGHKASIYEGGHRVPFFAVWPSHITAGAQSDVPVVGLDMVATVAALTGQTLDRSVVRDSVDLMPYLKQTSTEAPDRVLIHQSGGGSKPHYALRDGDWKLVIRGVSKTDFSEMTPVGLYNLSTNLAEDDEENLIGSPDQKERVDAMFEQYQAIRQEDGSTLERTKI